MRDPPAGHAFRSCLSVTFFRNNPYLRSAATRARAWSTMGGECVARMRKPVEGVERLGELTTVVGMAKAWRTAHPRT